jgi:hypothetical protein
MSQFLGACGSLALKRKRDDQHNKDHGGHKVKARPCRGGGHNGFTPASGLNASGIAPV